MYTAKDRTFLLKNHLKSVLGSTALQTMKVRGRTWRWLSAGDSRAREAIILLHGLSMSKNHWRSIIATLSKDYYVVAPDVPGLKLDQPASDPEAGLDGIARELSDFLSVAVGRPVHLVGHSMSAVLSLGLALRMAVPVKSLTLVSMADVNFTESLSQSLNVQRLSEFIEGMTEAQHLEYLRSMFFQPPNSIKYLARANWLEFARGKERCVALLKAMDKELSYIDEYGQGLDIPMMILTGREDPWSDLTRRGIFMTHPNIRRVELAGCRHLPFLEQPRAFSKALQSFVAQAGQRPRRLIESETA